MTERAGMIRLHWPLGAMLIIALSSLFWPFGGGWASRMALGWDVGVAVFLAGTLAHVWRRNTVEQIRERAAALDEAGPAVLPLAVTAAVASVVVVVGTAAAGGGREAALALATVALSWTFVHVIFGLHYAHRYYSAAGEGDREGLIFPGDGAPDYWDFLHFAIIIGVASQTADVQIADKEMRRLSTLHSLTAFVFNTVIVALAVNLAVGLLS